MKIVGDNEHDIFITDCNEEITYKIEAVEMALLNCAETIIFKSEEDVKNTNKSSQIITRMGSSVGHRQRIDAYYQCIGGLRLLFRGRYDVTLQNERLRELIATLDDQPDLPAEFEKALETANKLRLLHGIS